MRLLLLLSAFLTALSGALGGAAVSAHPVESSACVSPAAKAGAAARVAAVLPVGKVAAFGPSERWQPIVSSVAPSSRAVFGERRLE